MEQTSLYAPGAGGQSGVILQRMPAELKVPGFNLLPLPEAQPFNGRVAQTVAHGR